nr:anhydro-N-acetylmuramic acid kinase [Lusitaniella coriacea]
MMRVVGLISGTSVDGIDAALVDIEGMDSDLQVNFLAGETYPYAEDLRAQILAVGEGEPLSMEEFARLDRAIARQFSLAAQNIQRDHSPAHLIGSHGQTVFHQPPSPPSLGYSLQLGRGELIAHATGLPVVSNLRAADIAAGGQGAPLVSKIDLCLLGHQSTDRCVQNIGGIGNVTYLPARARAERETLICGWDTGPGNMLLDLAVQQLTNGRQTYDSEGSWAAQGTPCDPLVRQWLKQDFFQQKPPKSTGRELFGQTYLQQCQKDATVYSLSEADWLATLTELTVASIVRSYQAFLPQMPDEVLLCGGGSRNTYLKQRLQAQLASTTVLTTDEVGLNSEFKEAIAFAVLAYWKFELAFAGNLPQVTGAKQSKALGDVHYPTTETGQLEIK